MSDPIEAPERPDGEHRWRNRIVGHAHVDPNDLLANPHNHRIHPRAQAKAMESALDHLGWCDDVKVNINTGIVVDGHLRAMEAIDKGEPSIPVTYLDLTSEEERTALATHDAIGAMAVIDTDQLRSNVADLEMPDPLAGLIAGMLGDNPDDDTATPDPGDAPENKLEFGYVGFGQRRVACSTGEVEHLEQLLKDYKVEHGGNDDGFVEALIAGELEVTL